MKRNRRNASISLKRAGVVLSYDDVSLCSAPDTSPRAEGLGAALVDLLGGMRSSHPPMWSHVAAKKDKSSRRVLGARS